MEKNWQMEWMTSVKPVTKSRDKINWYSDKTSCAYILSPVEKLEYLQNLATPSVGVQSWLVGTCSYLQPSTQQAVHCSRRPVNKSKGGLQILLMLSRMSLKSMKKCFFNLYFQHTCETKLNFSDSLDNFWPKIYHLNFSRLQFSDTTYLFIFSK